MKTFPIRAELVQKLDALCAGSETRESVSAWAISLIQGAQSVTDGVAWQVLEGLGAADLPSTDREYLYAVADFLAWKEQLL